MKKKFWTINLFIILALIFVPLFSIQAHSTDEPHEEIENISQPASGSGVKQAIIYYNEACGMCAQYVATDLPAMLSEHGINDFIKKDYINDKSNRPEMNQMMTDLGVPLPLQSHIMTFVGDKYVLGGHVPQHIIDDLFKAENSQKFKRVIVYQDKMHGDVKYYKVWAIPEYADNFAGEIKTYPIDTSVTEYLSYLEENKSQLLESSQSQSLKEGSLLPTVLIAGFLDGLNPCAFAVLLFFIAFLFSIKRTRGTIWKMGIVYIGAIYLAYLLIGFGIFKAIMFIDSPHFMAKLGAWLVIGLGVINIIGYFFPKFPIKLKIPHASKATIQKWAYKSTLPAAFVLGFLVGLCTFPCSGGIYVAIIGLLAIKTTYWTGVSYLLLYNLVFVLPLIIILILSSNKLAVDKLTKWEQSESKVMKILAGITMIGLGLIILIWFV